MNTDGHGLRGGARGRREGAAGAAACGVVKSRDGRFGPVGLDKGPDFLGIGMGPKRTAIGEQESVRTEVNSVVRHDELQEWNSDFEEAEGVVFRAFDRAWKELGASTEGTCFRGAHRGKIPHG